MTKTTMNEYKREVSRALDDDFQRRMLESFAASYRVGRAAVFEGKDVRATTLCAAGANCSPASANGRKNWA